MDYKSVEKRLQAANTILTGETFDIASFQSLSQLLMGIHPRIDKTLGAMRKTVQHIDMMQKGDIISLTAEAIPAHTASEKKRKKYILIFLKYWRDLNSEVARVEKELNESQTAQGEQAAAWTKIFSMAKGPLGVITLVAAGVVLLRATEVSIIVKNTNCGAIDPSGQFSINMPGLSLPSEPIAAGSQTVAKLPPVTATVDASTQGEIVVSLFGVNRSFPLRSMDVLYDGKLLNGTTTKIELGSQKTHMVELRCR